MLNCTVQSEDINICSITERNSVFTLKNKKLLTALDYVSHNALVRTYWFVSMEAGISPMSSHGVKWAQWCILVQKEIKLSKQKRNEVEYIQLFSVMRWRQSK